MPNPIRCWAASGSSICTQLYIGVLQLLPTATQSYWSGLGSSQSIHYWSCWQYPFTLACTTKSFYWLYNNNTQYFQVLREGTQKNIFTYYVTWDFGRFQFYFIFKNNKKCHFLRSTHTNTNRKGDNPNDELEIALADVRDAPAPSRSNFFHFHAVFRKNLAK